MSTGAFNDNMKAFFDAEEGAFTSITAEEIRKQTFNVKAVIRNLLVRKVGRKNIPDIYSKNITMQFKIFEETQYLICKQIAIPCKFSKPDKDEMTIYFSAEKIIPKALLHEGDVWFIYFKYNDPSPWFGILSEENWNKVANHCYIPDYSVNETELEQSGRELRYNIDIPNLKISCVAPPLSVKTASSASGMRKKRLIRADRWDIMQKNRKIKGAKGEEIAVEIERSRLTAYGRKDLADKVERVSAHTDGLGYDILSYDIADDGAAYEIYIEVKTTSEDWSTPFDVSINEIAVSKEKGNAYRIYRIYNLRENSTEVEFYKLYGDIETNFNLTPTSFKASVKQPLI